MNEKLQNLAWTCLPKEFKEEVKKEYLVHHEGGDMKYSYGYSDALTDFFGEHNLTSDAEGEEMLMVSRKDIVELYQEVNKTISQCKGTGLATQSIGIKNVLWSFFGSKCLPDEEPKFKIGDEVYNNYDCPNSTSIITEVISTSWGYTYYLNDLRGRIHEKYLISAKQGREKISKQELYNALFELEKASKSVRKTLIRIITR